MSGPDIRRGASAHADPVAAVEALAAQIRQPDAATFVFASSRYDLEALAGALRTHFSPPLLGCTTAGEITPTGYGDGGLVGFSIPRAIAEIQTHAIGPLHQMDPLDLQQVGAAAHARFEARSDPVARAFGLLLVDGLCLREEQVIGYLASAMPHIPVVGGSAGDDLRHQATHVLVDGRFERDRAMLAVVCTRRPFATLKSQHFVPTDTKLVITGADPARRLVTRIDGRPAAEAYARVVGCPVEALRDEVFGNFPLMLRAGGEYYVRSVFTAEPDGSLSFACAIDEGVVLTLARGVDIVDTLSRDIDAAAAGMPGPHLVIGFECVHRRIEVEQRELVDPMSRAMAARGVLGFHSYGEQIQHLHVNQTFTGVVLGGTS